MEKNFEIKSNEELRRVVTCNEQQRKSLDERVYSYVDQYSRRFIADSPILIIATVNGSGRVDVSPKGDYPGFVQVVDKTTLLIPERRGNGDARGLRNIIGTHSVSLLFIVPRTNDVLRVTGTGIITKDPKLLEKMTSCGRPAQLALEVSVKECFFHCGANSTKAAKPPFMGNDSGHGKTSRSSGCHPGQV